MRVNECLTHLWGVDYNWSMDACGGCGRKVGRSQLNPYGPASGTISSAVRQDLCSDCSWELALKCLGFERRGNRWVKSGEASKGATGQGEGNQGEDPGRSKG
jgi:hypothetical protein